MTNKYIIALILLLPLSVIIAGVWWFQHQLRPASSTESDVYVMIEEGYSAGRVAKILEDEGVVRNGTVFYIYAVALRRSHNLQAGFYRLSPAKSPLKILDTITKGEVESMAVRIPGGATLEDIKQALTEAGFETEEITRALERDYEVGILDSKPENADLEGYLLPDTYHIPAGASLEGLVEMALVNTDQQIDSDIRRRWQQLGLSVHEGLTLASIVEKESPLEDMGAIAGVFWNRLQAGMKLEADSTVNYALGTRKLQSSFADIETEHPYNTYRIDGLPPGPISNVSLAAIRASANPEDHDWFFFLHKPDGETVFSRTFEQHAASQRRYLD